MCWLSTNFKKKRHCGRNESDLHYLQQIPGSCTDARPLLSSLELPSETRIVLDADCVAPGLAASPKVPIVGAGSNREAAGSKRERGCTPGARKVRGAARTVPFCHIRESILAQEHSPRAELLDVAILATTRPLETHNDQTFLPTTNNYNTGPYARNLHSRMRRTPQESLYR